VDLRCTLDINLLEDKSENENAGAVLKVIKYDYGQFPFYN